MKKMISLLLAALLLASLTAGLTPNVSAEEAPAVYAETDVRYFAGGDVTEETLPAEPGYADADEQSCYERMQDEQVSDALPEPEPDPDPELDPEPAPAPDPAPQPLPNPFSDVEAGRYYYDAVLWAANAEPVITVGTSDTQFSPNGRCTRAQIVTFLWRAAGSPQPQQTTLPFADVDKGKYYYEALLWAMEEEIVSGTDETHFSPAKPCTRAQAVTFLWRAAGKPAPEAVAAQFGDLDESGFYHDAAAWATEQGITNGLSADKFGPSMVCTRGQIVTILRRAQNRLTKTRCAHEYVKGQLTQPICSSPGWTEYTCVKCGKIRRDDYTPQTNRHKYTAKIAEEKYLAHPADCVTPAEYYFSCAVCGEKGTGTFSAGDALGHDYKLTVEAPGCTTKGCDKYTCARCGDVFRQNFTAPVRHRYQTTAVPRQGVDSGYDENVCLVCGYTCRDNYRDQTGWNYREGGWYYLYPSGSYASGTCQINGYSYTFNGSGRMTAINESDKRRLINAQPLRPRDTGIPVVDAEAQKIIQAATRPGDSNYDKLKGVYDYVVKNFKRPDEWIGILEYDNVLGARQMKYKRDLYNASFAYDFFVDKCGNCRHFSSGFKVLACALGFETYDVGDQIGSSQHFWNNIRLGGTLYHFDTRVKGAFCLTDSEADKYKFKYSRRDTYLAEQGQFDEAKPFTVRVTFKNEYATTINEHTWGDEVTAEKIPAIADWCEAAPGWYTSYQHETEQHIRVDPGPCEMTVELLSSESGRMTFRVGEDIEPDFQTTVYPEASFTTPISTEIYHTLWGWVYVNLTDPVSGRTITFRIYS